MINKSPFSFLSPKSDLQAAPSGRNRSLIDPKAVIVIRWLALIGQTIALVIVFIIFGFDGAFASTFGLVVVGALVNIWQSWRTRFQTRTQGLELLLTLFFDVLQLTGLLYLTGGLINPFAMLFLAPIVVSAALLNFRSTMSLVLLVGICASLIAKYHLPLPWSDGNFALPPLYVSGMLIALLVSSVFIGFYVWWLADNARETEASLAATQLVLERDKQVTILGTLAAAAAHKLGSPLNTIVIISHEMSRNLAGKISAENPIHQDLQLLADEAERCRVILSELDRDMSPDRLGEQVVMPISQMLRTMLDGKFSSLGEMLEVTSGSFDQSPEPLSKPLPDLKYALETLLDNAADYAASKIRLDIGWTQTHIDINLGDDGPGFNSTILARIGQPWNSTREGQKGHRGLGMFLATTLIEALEGQIKIANEDAGGADIHIMIPRARLL